MVSEDWDNSSKADAVWRDWRTKVVTAAEVGLGYTETYPVKPKGWDRQLVKRLQERNRVRNIRNASVGEERKKAQQELKKLQKLVKQRTHEVQSLECKKRNERLAKDKTVNPKQYWAVLKRLGLQKSKPSVRCRGPRKPG